MGLRPLLGPRGCCRYKISCTEFACHELINKPFCSALWSIVKRICSCNPFIK